MGERNHARILTSIWRDPEFTALTRDAQRIYVVALSQPDLNYCGVVGYTARRWATFAVDTTPRLVRKAATELAAKRFVLIDNDTEELWVRTFVKHDGLLSQPNIVIAMRRDFDTVLSPSIRAAFLGALPGTSEWPESMNPWPKPYGEPQQEPLGEPFPEGLPPPQPRGSRARAQAHGAEHHTPPPTPSPTPPEVNTETTPASVARETPVSPPPDFDAWWAGYPRKIAKPKAEKAWKARRREGVDAEELITARDNYAAHVEANQLGDRYVLYPATFLGPDQRWKDYLAPPGPAARNGVVERSLANIARAAAKAER